MDTCSLHDFVRSVRVLAVLDDSELAELTREATLMQVAAGSTIFRQGDASDAMYLVYSGRIRFLLEQSVERETSLGIAAKGDHFGETALITGEPRNATARAVEDSVLVRISSETFRNLVFANPANKAHFEGFIRATSIRHFLASCTDLAGIPPGELQGLIGHLQLETFKAGDVVIKEGAAADKFYLVEQGKLKVERLDGRQCRVLRILQNGDFFGEKALLETTTRNADVISLTDCRLYSLTREHFDSLIAKAPKLRKALEERIQSCQVTEPPIPYSELTRQELAADNVAVNEETQDGTAWQAGKRAGRGGSLFFPFIMQHDEMSCGTTCLMMISRFYGKQFSSSRLRDLAYVDKTGVSLSNLAAAAEQLGFNTSALRLDYDKLCGVTLPCIVHWEGWHYVVVYKISESHVWVADPALGRRKYTREFFQDRWTGITLVLEPTAEFSGQKEDRSSWRHFVQFVWPYRLILGEIFAASILMNLFGLATPIFTQNIVDKVISHSNVSMLNMMLAGMLLVIFFRFVVEILRQYLIVHTSLKVDVRMLTAFYKHLLALPLSYFKARKVGDFVARFGENVKIRSFLTQTALTLVLDAVLVLVYLSVMFFYNVKLAGVAMIFLPLYVLVTLLFTPVLRRLNMDSFAAHTASDSYLIESIHGIDTVKAHNLEFRYRWRWEEKFIRSLNIDHKLYNTAIYFHSLGELVGALSTTIILWFGARQVMDGNLTLGGLMAFMALLGSVTAPISRVIAAWQEVQETMVAIDRLTDVFSAKAEFAEKATDETGLMLKDPKGSLAFDKVYFRYGGRDEPYILSNLSFKVEPGRKVAIVGRSGSGKSTLVRLIPRIYEATEGRITIDGCDIRNMNLVGLRRLVGFVLQDNFIFSGTVRENISLWDPDESLDKVIEAAKQANAHDFVSNLSQGYETKIGEGGIQLSGGQRQRLSIAQVLYHNPRIILLDEPTSAQDTESEHVLQRNLETILKDRTAIIIAHRLSTVRQADHIIVLDRGEIAEQGTHEELMGRRGLYHYLNHQQLDI